MAKPKKADIEDNAENSRKGPNMPSAGGLHPKTLSKFYDDLNNIEQKASQVNGDKSASWEAFVSAGGDKEALRLARMIGKIAKDRRRSVLTNAIEYVNALELDAECDMQMSFKFTDDKVELVKGENAPIDDAVSATAKAWENQAAGQA